MLKMKELVEATGVSKATILYYVTEKLLPQPVKTSPNVAYYPSSTIGRIQLIRELQSKHRFSLAQIRAIIKGCDAGRDVETLIEFNKEVFIHDEGRPLSRKAFCTACDLTEEELQMAMELNLLIPGTDGSFDSADVGAGKLLKESLDHGLTLADFSYYSHLAEDLVSHEMALRKKLIRGMSYDEAMSATLMLTRNARFFRQYIIERVFKRQAMQQPFKLEGK